MTKRPHDQAADAAADAAPPAKAPDTAAFGGTEFLVREVVHGEADKAWTALSPKILHYLRSRFGRCSFPQGIEYGDFVSDAMLKILTSIDGFEDRGNDSFWKWVQTLAGNLWRDYWRRHERERKLGLLARGEHQGDEAVPPSTAESAPASGETPTQVVRFRELAQAEADCAARLPQPLRDVYVLRRQQQLSFAEIRARTGIDNEATLRSHYSRGRDRVRDCLGAKLDLLGTRLRGW